MKQRSGTLIVAPYIGEFGWELMNWQGRVRWLLRNGGFDRVLICATPDRRALYADPTASDKSIFCPLRLTDLPGHANEDHRVDDEWQPIASYRLREGLIERMHQACERLDVGFDSAEFLLPSLDGSTWPTSKSHQLFSDMRLAGPITTDIILVPRGRGLAPERNRTTEWWMELAARLKARGLKVETYAPRADLAIAQLSRTRLAIGASTGGLHLAGLCRCPQYVWGSGPEQRWTRMRITNRQRYETVWNPLGTPCLYDECGWGPSMDHVFDRALHALDAIGIRSRFAAGRRRLNPKWRVKRRLARVFETPPSLSRVPWRVRSLLGQYLV